MHHNTNKTINILHVFSGDLWAGAEVMIFNLLSQLIDYPNIRIMALSLNEGILSQKLRDLGIETFIIPEEKHSFPVILLKARKILKNLSIDIIHSHRYKENLLALFLGRLLGVKSLVTTIHGLSELPLHANYGKNTIRIKTRMDYFLMRGFFTRVIAVSHEMQRVLTDRYGFNEEQVAVIHNGIKIPQSAQSTNQPINRSTNHFFHIGTVGRLTPVKDYSFFLDIAAEIRKRREDVRFHILGEGPLKDELQKKRFELNLDDCVVFHKPVTDPFPFYRSLDLYLNTSSHEGFPITILEAMVCGLPVIASNVGGIPEVIVHNECGILFNLKDPADMASICLQLLDDVDTRAEMGGKAKDKVQNSFSASNMANNYCRQYVSVCK